MKTQFEKRCGILGLLLFILAILGLVFSLSGCSTLTSTSSTISQSSTVPTPQEIVAYAAPWIQAAATVANSLQAAGVINQAKSITSAETVANAALLACVAAPTSSNASALTSAMIPVYQQTTEASSSAAQGSK